MSAAKQGGKAAVWYACMLTVFAAAYIGAITFLAVPEANRDWVNTILGFVLGTALAAPIGYMIGTSDSSRQKNAPAPEETPAGTT